MKGSGLTILILVLWQHAFGQFAVVEKADVINVKSSASVGSSSVGRLVDGAVVYCLGEEKDGWISIDYDLGKLSKSGFILGSSVKRVDSLPKVPCSNLTETLATWSADSVVLTAATIPFDPKSNKLLFVRGTSLSEMTALIKINGKDIWGTDGNVPKVQYGQLVLQYGRKRVFLPTDNLFEPNLKNTKVYHDWKNKRIYISTLNGDGAGGYAALWIVENGRFKSYSVTRPF